MPSEKKTFGFNLIPPKSVTQVQIEEERDLSVVYSILLIFFASLIYFGLSLVQFFVIDPRVKAAEQAVTDREKVIASYLSVQSLHGELVIKTKTLEPVLSKKIDADEIFRITDELTASTAGTKVESYSRESSGKFVFVISANSFSDFPGLVTNAEKIKGVSSVQARSALYQSKEKRVNITLSLVITAS